MGADGDSLLHALCAPSGLSGEATENSTYSALARPLRCAVVLPISNRKIGSKQKPWHLGRWLQPWLSIG
jgi:hypothetical protein